MDQSAMSMLAALESPLPPPPAGEVFTPEQWKTMLAILDTFVPSITTSKSEEDSKLCVGEAEYTESILSIKELLPSSVDPSIISTYLSESLSSLPDLRPSIQRCFGQYVPADQLKGLRFILYSLSTRPGSLLLTGSTTPFHLQSPSAREQILMNWSKSYLPILRGLFRSLSLLAKRMWVGLSPNLPKIIGFPAVPKHGKRGEDHPYEFMNFSSPDSPSTIETDVVIVGSGCGAGVCAKKVAEAGFSVIMAEKGRYFPSTHFPMQSGDAGVHLMENGGAVVSDDGSIAVLAGSCFGGGGTVNWSASLQTQRYVREEWADQGLPFFTSEEFQRCLDKVCADIGATTKGIQHNFANRVLLEGSRRLGYEAKEVPQNTGGKEHYCGYCTFGCAGATKNGPAVSFFPAAAKAGAKFIQGFDVRHVNFEQIDGKKTAVGVTGLWSEPETEQGGEQKQKREITVKAKKVIVCAGTLNSPLLLKRSGLTNPNIGRNLHLHPATIVCARFDERVNPWEGMMSKLPI
jgi:GMC oxidoreductase